MDQASMEAFDGKVKQASKLAKKILSLQSKMDKLTREKDSASAALSILLKEIQEANTGFTLARRP